MSQVCGGRVGSEGHRASLLRGALKGGLVVFDHLVSHAFFDHESS